MLEENEYQDLVNAIEDYNEGRFEKAYGEFNKLIVSKGDDESQYYVGLMYYHGQYVEQNQDTAISYWKMSAKQRNQDANFQLESISFTRNGRF